MEKTNVVVSEHIGVMWVFNDFKGYSLITHTYIRNFSSKEVGEME